MIDENAVILENISKCYHLYARPQDRLKQSLFGMMGKNYAQEFWALRGITFTVKKGETLGIVGCNGSGKSTLLQILAGTLSATSGSVRIPGHVTALLEIGSGFNPEFTGRENVFLNGAILGHSAAQMEKRLDDIIGFADIGEFIDQPVKFYSSGMFVRLAFAVQVIMEPDLLLIDEALAVGDAAFQMKCFNRMKQLAANGTTIILVTHDVQTVRTFCHRAVWLHSGQIKAEGCPAEVTSLYVQHLFGNREANVDDRSCSPQAIEIDWEQSEHLAPDSLAPLQSLADRTGLIRWGSRELIIESLRMDGGRDTREHVFEYGEALRVAFQVKALRDIASKQVGFGFAFRNTKGLDIIVSTTYEEGHRFPGFHKGQSVRVTFETINILAPGEYALVVSVEDRTDGSPHYYDFIENAVLFKVLSKKTIYSLVLPDVKQNVALLSAPEALGQGF